MSECVISLVDFSLIDLFLKLKTDDDKRILNTHLKALSSILESTNDFNIQIKQVEYIDMSFAVLLDRLERGLPARKNNIIKDGLK